jgi:hypothetical protein
MKSLVPFVCEAIFMKRWSVCLICCSVGGGIALAQPAKDDGPAVQPAPTSRPTVIRTPSPAAQTTVIKIKEIKASLDRFQRLLAMSPEDREKALTSKSDKQRSYLRRELLRYEEMPKDERETALQGLRVWYYVRELVKHPTEARTNALPIIPEVERKPVEVRLRRWDLLPQDLQKEIMDNERTIRYVVQLEGLSRQERKEIQATLPQSLQKSWDEKLEEWHAIPIERRQRIYAQFQKFFELSPKERAKFLETLPRQDRDQAEKSLQVVQELDKLSPEDRAACLESFKDFAETPAKSSQRFLHLETIRQWKEMSTKEKDILRKVRSVLVPGSEPPIPGGTSKPPLGEDKPAPPAVPGTAK